MDYERWKYFRQATNGVGLTATISNTPPQADPTHSYNINHRVPNSTPIRSGARINVKEERKPQ